MNRVGVVALTALCIALPSRTLAAVDVLTYHNDNLRSGWNANETTLTPSRVAGGGLKPLFSEALGGLGYGQPLVATAEATAKGTHDLVIVGTDRDTMLAFDAHDGSLVWSRTIVPSGETVVTPKFTGCINMLRAGISGTPVIDRARDTVYVVAETLSQGAQPAIHFRLYALALGSGANKVAPKEITAHLPGRGGRNDFLPDYQQQRVAVTLANNRVYVGFGGTCDFNGNSYHGWIFSYDPDSLVRLSVYNDTSIADPYGNYMGGIWMSGNGLSVDARGNILFVSGNGTFDNRVAFGDSALKLAPDLSRVVDSFTPQTASSDNASDSDFGSGGLMLLPDVPGLPSVAFGQGKDGLLTMIDQDRFGGYTPGGPDKVLGELSLGGTWSSPAYFAGQDGERVYTTGGPLYEIGVKRKPAKMKVLAQTSQQFTMNNGNGETPAISSNGKNSKSAIVWIVSWQSNDRLQLLAYAADNLTQTIFTAPLGRWDFSQTNSIMVPTIANGIVYVVGYRELYAFAVKK